MFEWLLPCLCNLFIFSSWKDVYQILLNIKIDDAGNRQYEVLKSCYCQTSWYLFAGFKTMILYSVHPKTKLCLFSVKIWFVKTSIRIAKYKSQVVDLNLYYDFFSFRWMRWWGCCWQLNKLSMIQMCLFPSVSHIDSHLFHEWWKSLLDYQKSYF